MATFTACWK